MSIINSIISCGFLPTLHLRPSQSSETRTSSSLYATSKNHHQTLFWDKNTRMKKYYKSTLFLVRSVVEPGAPLPPDPPFNFLNWIVGIAVTVVLPFFSHKLTSLLKIKNEVDTAVQMAEDLVETVEKVAEGVEKAAEDIAEDLPGGGRLRKAVDFVEHVAERANRDAHRVVDFINEVQEVEEKVEDCVESLAEEAITHKRHKNEHNKEVKAEEPPKNESTDDR